MAELREQYASLGCLKMSRPTFKAEASSSIILRLMIF
jgi:hypothetical protein